MTELHAVLMRRDDLTFLEADEIVKEMRDRFRAGENPEDLLYEEGLEPDYLFDLI